MLHPTEVSEDEEDVFYDKLQEATEVKTSAHDVLLGTGH